MLDTAAELGIPLTMYGLDVFYDVRVSREQARELVRRGGAAELAGLLVLHQCERFGTPDATVGDARRLFGSSSVQLIPVLDGTAYLGAVARDDIGEAGDGEPITGFTRSNPPTATASTPAGKALRATAVIRNASSTSRSAPGNRAWRYGRIRRTSGPR